MAREEMDTNNSHNNKQEIRDDVAAVDLPAPTGWTKKFTPKKGATPRRNEIVFVSPTGEEIVNKRQLDQYLKSHPGSPSVSEFDWGTGDTPRRSARISVKSKATETPEAERPKKMQKNSSSKKGVKEKKDNNDGEGETPQGRKAATEETKASAEVEMKDAEDAGNHKKGEVDTEEEALAGKDTLKESDEQKTEITIDETKMEKLEASNECCGAKEEDAGYEENGEKKEQVEPEDPPPQVSVSNETAAAAAAAAAANSVEEKESVKSAAVFEVADAKVNVESVVGKVGQEDHHPDKEEVANAETKPDSESIKEYQQDAEKPVENHHSRAQGIISS